VTRPIDAPDGSPEAVAGAFLAALDDRRWHDAARLVDPRTAERFHAFWLARLESEAADGAPDDVPSDTRFASTAELLGVEDAADAAHLTATELLARLAEALHPDDALRRAGALASDGAIRVIRTPVDSTHVEPDGMRVRYRIEWRQGEIASDRGVHTLELVRTPTGWAVRDADLGGYGGGHILPPLPS
jgi:hypothetical protein